MIRVEVPRPKNLKPMTLEEHETVHERMVGKVADLNGLTANWYQKEAMRTASGMNKQYPMLLNGVLGLAGESGECVDMIKKHLFQGHPLDKEHMAKELGDVAWYLAVAAHEIGYPLSDILMMNVVKLRDRYPEGFDPERSLHRKEGDI